MNQAHGQAAMALIGDALARKVSGVDLAQAMCQLEERFPNVGWYEAARDYERWWVARHPAKREGD